MAVRTVTTTTRDYLLRGSRAATHLRRQALPRMAAPSLRQEPRHRLDPVMQLLHGGRQLAAMMVTGLAQRIPRVPGARGEIAITEHLTQDEKLRSKGCFLTPGGAGSQNLAHALFQCLAREQSRSTSPQATSVIARLLDESTRRIE
jgi:hypothetical protein